MCLYVSVSQTVMKTHRNWVLRNNLEKQKKNTK